jgi:hypothetical protein
MSSADTEGFPQGNTASCTSGRPRGPLPSPQRRPARARISAQSSRHPVTPETSRTRQPGHETLDHRLGVLHPAEVVGATATELCRVDLVARDVGMRQLGQEVVERGARHVPVLGEAQREDRQSRDAQRRLGIVRQAGHAVVPVAPGVGPVADHTARLVAREAGAPAREVPGHGSDPVHRTEQPAQHVTAPARPSAPVRRATGHDGDAAQARVARRHQRAELRAEAVAADAPTEVRPRAHAGVQARRQVVLEQFAIAPVVASRGAQTAAAEAPPFVHRHAHAARRESSRESVVMARRDAHRRHEQQAGASVSGRGVHAQRRRMTVTAAHGPLLHPDLRRFSHGTTHPRGRAGAAGPARPTGRRGCA